ncbi:MAG: hypothetical protein GY811_21700 [Myxococcales bacterium]|nr:hypothetical protein [Myxococcales bacterium]
MNRPTTRLLSLLAGLLLIIGLRRFMSYDKSASVEPTSGTPEAEAEKMANSSVQTGRYRAVSPPMLRKKAEPKPSISPHKSFRNSIREQLISIEPELIACLADGNRGGDCKHEPRDQEEAQTRQGGP